MTTTKHDDEPTARELQRIRDDNERIARVMRGDRSQLDDRCPTCGDDHAPDEGCDHFIGDDGPQDTRGL
jgi:hypothetical protein